MLSGVSVPPLWQWPQLACMYSSTHFSLASVAVMLAKGAVGAAVRKALSMTSWS
jgi:hypothetical protein